MHSFVTIDPTPPRACFTGAGVGGSEGSFQLHTGGEWCTGPSPLRAFSQLVSRRRHRALAPEPPASPALKRARPGAAPPSRRSHPRLTRRSSLCRPRRPPLRSRVALRSGAAPKPRRSEAAPERHHDATLRSEIGLAPERNRASLRSRRDATPERDRRDAGAPLRPSLRSGVLLIRRGGGEGGSRAKGRLGRGDQRS